MKKSVNLSVWDFANIQQEWKKLPKKEKKRIQSYTRKEVEQLPASSAALGSSEYWHVRLDAAFVLHYHHNPIQRHEAAFALGAFTYRDELEKSLAVKHLRYTMRYDPSIVARHEAIEALGSPNTFCILSVSAAADMTKINYLWPDYKDVQATAEETFDNIITWLKKMKYDDVVQELLQWKRLPRLHIPEGILTGDLNEARHIYQQSTNMKGGKKK